MGVRIERFVPSNVKHLLQNAVTFQKSLSGRLVLWLLTGCVFGVPVNPFHPFPVSLFYKLFWTIDCWSFTQLNHCATGNEHIYFHRSSLVWAYNFYSFFATSIVVFLISNYSTYICTPSHIHRGPELPICSVLVCCHKIKNWS